MNPRRAPAIRRRTALQGFSLVELMVVLVIIAILSALVFLSLGGLTQSYKLTTSGQNIMSQLEIARQSALGGSHAVQVRFYYLPDYNDSPAASASLAVYRGMQCFIENSPTTAGVPVTPLTKPDLFPAPVVISGNATISTLMSSGLQSPGPTDPSITPFGMNYKYVVFRFKPDGSTDLGSGANGITLVLEAQKVSANGLPANFQTILIDPTVGSVRSFRP